ncbi:hypothetical protein [Ralstonia pseudosolanacearum]|uniref:hypothetical protein n=2 Tax=Ralstonia pseudosolanacearum TaxID=1310165 RepID=UPI003CF1D714
MTHMDFQLAQTIPDDGSVSAMALARTQFMDLDDSSIGRIAQATEEIWQSQNRVVAEFIAIGARLVHIDGIIMGSLTRTLGDEKMARRRGSAMLSSYATTALRMTDSRVALYTNVYRRFANNSFAITNLTLGEMQVLTRKDITDDEVEKVIEHKLKTESFKREDIRSIIEKLRKTEEDLTNTSLQLQVTQEELNENLNNNSDLEAQIRTLAAQLTASQEELTNRQRAMDEAQLQVTRSSSTVSTLQQEIDRITRERNALATKAENAQPVAVKEPVEVHVLPPGLQTLDDALQEANRRLEAANEDLKRKRDELAQLDEEISKQQADINSSAEARQKMVTLLADIESVAHKYQSAQLSAIFSNGSAECRPILEGLAGVLTKFLGEVNAALATTETTNRVPRRARAQTA